MNSLFADRGSAFIKSLTAIGIAFIVAVMAVGLYFDPTKTWVKQNRELGALSKRVDEAEARNDKLRQEQQQLMSDEYIERKAREEHGLIKPGEEAFVVIDPPATVKPTDLEAPPVKESFIDRIKRFFAERDKLIENSGE